MKLKIKEFFSKTEINYSINQPLFSEGVLLTNCYQELQKNGWCEIVEDKPESLLAYITIRNTKKSR